MKRIAIGAVLALLLAGAGASYVWRNDIALHIFRQAANDATAANLIDELPDGLTAAFCGTGSPLPDRTRAGPCFAVVAGEHLFVFDTGDGATETLALMGLLSARVEAVFLTHLHSDHIDGLGGLALQRWATGAATAPLPVYGGEGVERVAAGFNEAYAIDSTNRIAHHGGDVVPPSGFGIAPHAFTMPEGQDRMIVYDQDGVRITAFNVPHGPVRPAIGYRIDYRGRSIVVSGDTSASETLQREAQGVDLLVHEGLQPRLVAILEEASARRGQTGIAQIFHDIPDYHTSPEAAADIAREAHVGALAFTHLIPPLPVTILEGPFLGDARRRYRGPLWVMRDGDIVILPAAGGVERRNTLR